MTNPILTSQYNYNNGAQRWQGSSGRFVSEQAVTDEMRRHQEATFNVLENATTQLYNGGLSLSQWQNVVAHELKDAHLAQSMFAVGGKRNMTQANYGRVGGVLRDEYGYLNGFATEIANGTVSESQALSRIRQYGKATQQSYWREYELATPQGYVIWWDLNPGDHCEAGKGTYGCVEMAMGSPYEPGSMPAHPGDGGSTCRGNCNCTERREKK